MNTDANLNMVMLEDFYDQLAETIDTVGQGQACVLLGKLALLLAREVRDPQRLPALIREAAFDL